MRQWIIRSANVVLFVGGCFLAAQIAVSVLVEITLPDEVEVGPVTPVVHTPRQDAEERQAILDRNLFGARLAGEALVVEEDDDDDDLESAMETKLPLELLGTVASADESLSNAAIFDRSARDHQVVFVGDTLEGHPRVEVLAIKRGTVFLQNGAKRERLDLKDDGGEAAAKPRRSRRSRGNRQAARPSIQERIQEMQSANSRTTASLYSQARIVPEWSEGAMVGVRLNQVKPGSLYEKLGIESGDVITSLNGISIDSPQASSRLLTEFTQAEEFKIELQDGEVIEVDSGELSDMLGDEG